MIYSRPHGVHHPVARILAALLLVAMLVLGFLGDPPEIKAQTVWKDPTGLPAMDAPDATGRSAPIPLAPELDGSFPVSVSTSPVLVWNRVPAGVSQARFKVITLAASSPQVIWQSTVAVGSGGVAKARVPGGLLKQGRTYAWAAESAADPEVNRGPFNITIDLQRSGSQPLHSFAGVAVAEGTGDLVYMYRGPTLSTLGGPVGWTLLHRPSNPARHGVPDGWSLMLSGSARWESVNLNEDGSVTLTSTTGSAVSYVKAGGDQWRPLVGRFQTAGQSTLLTQNADGTFSATDSNRTITVFSKPTANRNGHPIKVWSLEAPTVQQAWTDGRLSTLTDPVTGNQVYFAYGGEDICPTEVDPGFVPAPAGELCAIVDWTGGTTMLQYVKTNDEPQIGRIATGIGLGRYAQSTDIAWDGSGRIAEVREPRVATAIASGVIEGLDGQDNRVVTQVAYDAQGRVAAITAPQGLVDADDQPDWLERRATQTYDYAPFTVTANGVVVKQEWLDPVSLRPIKARNESGNVIAYTYDDMGNLTRTTDQTSGTVTETRFNAQGQAVEQLGPTKGPLTSPTAPRTATAYDQDEQGRDWKGLATRWWNNAGFTGVPAGGTTGPVLAGGTDPVASLSLNWSSNPSGAGGPWSARLTGTYEAAADGPHRFTNTTGAKLWVNGDRCQPECRVVLAKGGSAALLIDVVSPDGAAAGINVLVTRPDGTRSAVPTAQLRPNYGLASSTTVRDVVAGSVQDLVTKAIYNPVTTQLVAVVSPSGARQTRTYEPFDPAKGQWGRSTGVTDASGKTTTSSYYTLDAVATDCEGQRIAQQAQQQSVTYPGGMTASLVGTPGGGTVKATSGATTICGSISEDRSSTVATTTGIGPAVVESSNQFVDGNPLEVSTTTTTQGESHTEVAKVDTNGNLWQKIDAQGTRTVQIWNPLTGYVDRVIETTKRGETRTTEYTYAANGEVATVVVNGRVLLTNEYAPNGTLIRSTLGNGAVQTFELDANNNGRLARTVFPDGTEISQSSTVSPSGRLLSRTLSGPTGTSTFAYTYNRDGRLVDTRLTGSIPARATGWQSEYAGPDGANGNRSSRTWTLADGTRTTTDFTYGPDNRLLSASNGRLAAGIEYDAAGRATRVGGATLTYDAAGHLLTASEGSRTYTFGDAGTRVSLSRVQDDKTTTITAISSGETLILGDDGLIDGQAIAPAAGVKVLLDRFGAPARWIYDDGLGNGTWTSERDGAPTATYLYAPGGEPINMPRTSTPDTPLDLIVDSLGWLSGRGATTLRLPTPLMIIGARVYTPDGGRWLQPDPDPSASFNAYEYATGDPINLVDPGGNAAWGWIAGAVAAAVTGILIGALTFGIGVGGAAGYGYSAIVTQMLVSAGLGALEGAIAEVVTQSVDHGAVVDWASVGIAVGIGAGLGALTAGLSSYTFKIALPGKRLRVMAANSPAEVATTSRMAAYRTAAGARQMRVTAGQEEKKGLLRMMFTSSSWKKVAQQRARAQVLSPDEDPFRLWGTSHYSGGNVRNMVETAAADSSSVAHLSQGGNVVTTRPGIPSQQAIAEVNQNTLAAYTQRVSNRSSSLADDVGLESLRLSGDGAGQNSEFQQYLWKQFLAQERSSTSGKNLSVVSGLVP